MSKAVAKTNILKPITICYGENEKYVLDFSRATAVFAQDNNFDVDEIDKKPTKLIPELFYYALLKEQGSITKKGADALFEKLFPNGLSAQVLTRLISLYRQAAYIGIVDIGGETEKNSNTVVEM